ncbi:MAG: hypothetical protein KC418_17555, partial [Anaerolineales bacterium]|nr:hypothetical protein [Anaerolineales bacterium]
MALIPSLLLKQLYTFGSLKNVEGGVQFSIKNRLSDAYLTEVGQVLIDGVEVPMPAIAIRLNHDQTINPADVSARNPVSFPLRETLDILANVDHLPNGKHKLEIRFKTTPFGKLKLEVEDAISADDEHLLRIPRDRADDYGADIIKKRQEFVQQFTGARLNHVAQFTFDPQATKGNIENLTGVAQVPLGFAGPLHIDGENAKGEFLIPLATTEGTLVASYNRGIKLLNLSGGVRCTVVGDAMQRAPV